MIPKHLGLARGLLLVALGCASAGCHGGLPPGTELPPPPVSVSHPVVRDVVDQDNYEGRVTALLKVEIRTRSRGYLTKINFKDGDVVDAGKTLYQIDPRPYQANLEAALAQEKGADAALQFATAEYARVRKLVAKNAASQEELESWAAKQEVSKAEKLKAQAAIDQAKLDVEYATVKAPFAGQISRTQVDEGTLVNSGGGDTLLSTLTSVGPVYVYFNIDERSLMRYRRDYKKEKNGSGKEPHIADLKIPVFVALEGEDTYKHKGTIVYAAPSVDTGTGTLEVRARMPNESGLLQDGMRARVRVPVSDPHKSMLITERAIANEQGRKFVYVVNAKNEVERRDVVLDRVFDGMQVVRRGLTVEDLVIVNGVNRVREGLVVKPTEITMPEDFPPEQAPAPREEKE